MRGIEPATGPGPDLQRSAAVLLKLFPLFSKGRCCCAGHGPRTQPTVKHVRMRLSIVPGGGSSQLRSRGGREVTVQVCEPSPLQSKVEFSGNERATMSKLPKWLLTNLLLAHGQVLIIVTASVHQLWCLAPTLCASWCSERLRSMDCHTKMIAVVHPTAVGRSVHRCL
jgi:hypothetical protein